MIGVGSSTIGKDWLNIGRHRPKEGVEIYNDILADILQTQTLALDMAELRRLDVLPVTTRYFIKSGDSYLQPMPYGLQMVRLEMIRERMLFFILNNEGCFGELSTEVLEIIFTEGLNSWYTAV